MSNITGVSGYCSEGYNGPFCDVCNQGYANNMERTCVPCEAGVGALMLPAAVIATLLAFIGIAAAWNARKLQHIKDSLESQPVQNKLETARVKVRIILSFFQVLSSLGVVFDFPSLPIWDMIKSYFGMLSLDFISVMPLGCLGEVNYHDTLLFRTLFPLAVISFLQAINIVNRRRLLGRARVSEEAVATAEAGLLNWFAGSTNTISFLLLFLVYPSTSSAILRTFQCYPLDDGSSWLRADFSVDCNTASHTYMMLYAFVMILVYPLGTPLLYAYFFHVSRAELQQLKGLEDMRRNFEGEVRVEVDYEKVAVDVQRKEETKRRERTRGSSSRVLLPKEKQHEAEVVARTDLISEVLAEVHLARKEAIDFMVQVQVQKEESQSMKWGQKRLVRSVHMSEKQVRSAYFKAKVDHMREHEEQVRAGLPDHVQKLIDGYDMDCYWFEIFQCVRKLALVGVPVFFDVGSVSQSTYGLLISFLSFGMYTAYHPYTQASNDRLEQITQIQIFFTLLMSIVLRSRVGEVTSEGTASNVDILLSITSFLPMILGMFLSSPLADLMETEKQEDVAASCLQTMQRISTRLNRSSRSISRTASKKEGPVR